MAAENPPIRLAADPNTPEPLRHLVTHARKDIPDATSLAQFDTRLQAAIAANVTAPTVQLPQSTLTTGLAGTKPLGIVLAVMAGGLIASGIWFGSRGNESAVRSIELSAAPSVEVSAMQLPATAQRDPSPLTPAVAVASAATVESNAATTSNSTADGATATPKGESSGGITKQQPVGRDPNQEAALLLSARSALVSNPALALRITKQHAQRFPNGNLAQEREVIAIEALRRLGQTDAAQKRGAAFERQYPGSAHRSKIEQTLQGK